MPTRKKEEEDLIPNYSVQFSLNVSEFPVFRTFKKSYKHFFQRVCLKENFCFELNCWIFVSLFFLLFFLLFFFFSAVREGIQLGSMQVSS